MRGLVAIIALPLGVLAQMPVDGRVIDASTREALPYCNVGVVGAEVGTLTNAEGRFHFDAVDPAALLRFSYVGYVTMELPATEAGRGDVAMRPSSTVLAQLDVFPSDAQYERVIRAARSLKATGPEQGRAYFELETHLDDRPVEVVECFFNARTDRARVTGLDLKHGRIGIAPMGDRYFVSLNTTKAITLFDPTGHNACFPDAPLHWSSVRKLRRAFKVELVSSSEEEGVDHLRIVPRDSSDAAFTTDLWLGMDDDTVHALEVRCVDCAAHPFLPLWEGHAIERADLRIRQTWRAGGLDHVELAYAFNYMNGVREERIATTAVLHLFDRGGAFILPLFDYDRDQSDYRRITFQPYDTVFWQRSPVLLRTAQQQRDRDFFQRNGLLTGSTAPHEWKGKGFFESNYAQWSAGRRLSLKNLPPAAEDATRPAGMRSNGAVAPISQVRLVAQLYLDLDTANGELHTFSATVLDGFRSFYHLPEQTYTDCFINLFFDLCEMERRRMDVRLKEAGTDVGRARAVHAEAVQAMESTTDRYIKETRLGADQEALRRWNDRVKNALGIDNMALFGLEAPR